jgi:hypothetical protein
MDQENAESFAQFRAFARTGQDCSPIAEKGTPTLYCTRSRLILTRNASEGGNSFPRLRSVDLIDSATRFGGSR